MTSTMDSFENPSVFLSSLEYPWWANPWTRQGEIPRFLFRGFSKRSGGNSNLNTSTAITPHAFYGIPKDTQDNNWIGSTTEDFFSSHRQYSILTKPVKFLQVPYSCLRAEVCAHLDGNKKVNSHFSSWTADLQIAMELAKRGPSPHIGVLDTQNRHDENIILHVPDLYEAGVSEWNYPNEYLVYGPVQGKSYTCMTLAWQMYSTDLFFDLLIMWSPKNELAHIQKAHDRAARHSFFRAESAWLDVLLGTCKSWELALTVVAAEWGRSKANADRKLFVSGMMHKPSLEEMKMVVSNLSWLIERAARSPNLVLPFHNPHTYRLDLPGVDYMLILLSSIEGEIRMLRSKPQLEPFSIIGYFWPRSLGQKRKANEMETPGDSETSKKTAKK